MLFDKKWDKLMIGKDVIKEYKLNIGTIKYNNNKNCLSYKIS